ncbi:MAG: hypothetical protein ABJN84_17955 [Flavobacteriaceae bacterium]
MEPKTSKSYQKEVLEKYKKDKGGHMMSGYLSSPTRSSIRNACLWLLDRRKEKNDEYILNRFFQFKEGEDKARHIRGLKSEKADKFVPVINFLKGKTNDTSDENIELISWLIDFKPRPREEYLDPKNMDLIEDELTLSGSKRTNSPNSSEIISNKNSKSDLDDDEKIGWIKLTITVILSMTLLIFGIQKWYSNPNITDLEKDSCMTWADTLYIKVSCDMGSPSKYGTAVEPLDKNKLKSMKKAKVYAGFDFFADNGKPLIWYNKNKKGEIEYFTAPGLHPTNGETLRKITPYIIQTYVPKHRNKKSSFVQ